MNLSQSKKGMSQTLALIVAASVLMMTALTVIFLAQGSLGDFGQTSGAQSCVSAIDAQCGAGANTVEVPSSCYQGPDNNPVAEADNQLDGGVPDYGNTYDCPTS